MRFSTPCSWARGVVTEWVLHNSRTLHILLTSPNHISQRNSVGCICISHIISSWENSHSSDGNIIESSFDWLYLLTRAGDCKSPLNGIVGDTSFIIIIIIICIIVVRISQWGHYTSYQLKDQMRRGFHFTQSERSPMWSSRRYCKFYSTTTSLFTFSSEKWSVSSVNNHLRIYLFEWNACLIASSLLDHTVKKSILRLL